MKHHYRATALWFALLLVPVLVTAQTTNAPAFGSQLSYHDSDESGDTDYDWMRAYRYQSNDLQEKISDLFSTASSSVYMPVLFGVGVADISPNFGAPRSGGRTHKGEDIMAMSGTPIVSPSPAVVLRTGVGDSEGNYVYTANPGGETFVYMHLDRIGEGVETGLVLKQGSLIGYVGNTGNASGGAAHLHFEIHDSSSTATDPFPRLTAEFSLGEKMSYVSTILEQTTDDDALAEFLVRNFRSTFTDVFAVNATVPPLIAYFLITIPDTSTPKTSTPTKALPANDLAFGSRGTRVVTLQTYLIQKNTGPAAVRLAAIGATAYFGERTKAALIEFQAAHGISPRDGYYGPATQAFIAAHPLETTPPPASTDTTTQFTRDLYRGMSGDDVLALQKLLNANGYTLATTGHGSPGNETNFFGTMTENAVMKFQTARGIPATGYVEGATRTGLEGL